jgi:hypothetical protein
MWVTMGPFSSANSLAELKSVLRAVGAQAVLGAARRHGLAVALTDTALRALQEDGQER